MYLLLERSLQQNVVLACVQPQQRLELLLLLGQSELVAAFGNDIDANQTLSLKLPDKFCEQHHQEHVQLLCQDNNFEQTLSDPRDNVTKHLLLHEDPIEHLNI